MNIFSFITYFRFDLIVNKLFFYSKGTHLHEIYNLVKFGSVRTQRGIKFVPSVNRRYSDGLSLLQILRKNGISKFYHEYL